MMLLVKILTLVLILSSASCVLAEDTYTEHINGKWIKKGVNKSECDCGDCIDIELGYKLQTFCIESNQIYLNVYYQLNTKLKRVYLLFENVIEVGTGGAVLPWDKFDKQKPLAEIDVSEVEKGTIGMKWHGFTRKDNPAKRYRFGDAYAGTYERQMR